MRIKALEIRKTQAMERIEAKLDLLLSLAGIDPNSTFPAPETKPGQPEDFALAVEPEPEPLPAPEPEPVLPPEPAKGKSGKK